MSQNHEILGRQTGPVESSDSHLPSVAHEVEPAIADIALNPNVGIELFIHSQFGGTNGYGVKYKKTTQQPLPGDLSGMASQLLRATGGSPQQNLGLDKPIFTGESIIMKKQIASGIVYVIVMNSPKASPSRSHVGLSVVIPSSEQLEASCLELEANPSLWLQLFRKGTEKADQNVVTHSYTKVIPAAQLADGVKAPSWVPEAIVDEVLERSISTRTLPSPSPLYQQRFFTRLRKSR